MQERPLRADVCRRTCLRLLASAASLGVGGLSVSRQAQDIAAAPAGPAPVPLYTNLFTRLAAPVEIGRRRSLFVLDTGAEATAISDQLAAELQLVAGPRVTVHSVTASSVVPSVRIPRFRVQSETFEDVLAPVFQLEELGAEGLLGLNHLQAFNLLLDIRNRSATLNPNQTQGVRFEMGASELATRIQRRLSAVPSYQKDGLLFMDIRVGDAPVTAFLDTGAQHSVGNEQLLARLGYPARQLQTIAVHGVSGPAIVGRSGPTMDIELGPKRLRQVPLLFSDLHIFQILGLADRPALLIGADLLSRFDQVRIDYKTNRIALGSIMRGRSVPRNSVR